MTAALVMLVSGSLNLLGWVCMALGWRRYREPAPATEYPGISILIAARNEAARLPALLSTLLNQYYPGEWEVILVLDRCTDDSEAIAAQYAHPRLKVCVQQEVPPGMSPKKCALTQAAAAARYDWFAFTDADCMPGTAWLLSLSAAMPGKELLLGLSPYAPTQGLLGAVIRYETWLTAWQYGSLALLGQPYMGVGRNMACSRAFFQRAGGYAGHMHRLSGDDDLLVNRHAQAATTALVAATVSQVPSLPVPTWGAWIRQKLRHLSAGTAYSRRSQLILAFFNGTHTIFYLSLLVTALTCGPVCAGWSGGIVAGTALLLRLLLLLLCTGILAPPAARSTGGWMELILLDPVWWLYHLILVPAGWVLKPKWKN